MKQLDIFGNEIDVIKVNEETKKQRSNRLSMKDMFRKLHGYNKSDYCKNCIYCVCHSGRNRNYYKCIKIGLSNSEATDIRLKEYACSLFLKKN